jgi:hypothetical protein
MGGLTKTFKLIKYHIEINPIDKHIGTFENKK